jgi:hypothetical protein
VGAVAGGGAGRLTDGAAAVSDEGIPRLGRDGDDEIAGAAGAGGSQSGAVIIRLPGSAAAGLRTIGGGGGSGGMKLCSGGTSGRSGGIGTGAPDVLHDAVSDVRREPAAGAGGVISSGSLGGGGTTALAGGSNWVCSNMSSKSNSSPAAGPSGGVHWSSLTTVP